MSFDYALRPDPPTPGQKALSNAVAEADWNGGNLFPWLTNVLMPRAGAGGIDASDETVSLGGPSALPKAYWTRRDHVAPSVPADISWTSSNDVTPKGLIITTTIPAERLLNVRTFATIADGMLALGPDTPAAYDPVVAMWLGDALTFEMGRCFSVGSSTPADPVHAIGGYAGIGHRTLGRPLAWTDLMDAYGDMIGDGRFLPSVAWVSPQAYSSLKDEKDGVGGYLHETSEPLLLDVRVNADGSQTRVPVLPLRGIVEGPNSMAILADSKRITAVHRPVGGLLVRVDRSDHGHFDTDQVSFRLTRRIDFGIAVGFEGAVMRIDCVTPI